MKCKIDLHVHSKYSGDNSADPEETVAMAIERKLQGIVFTEHYYFGASEYVEKMREKYRDELMIFRGVEFSSAEGHCLIYGVDTDALSIKQTPISEVVRIVNEQGGVVVPSHPYRGGNSVGDRIKEIRGICALEGYNGCNHHSFNLMAISMAKTLNIPFTGGSDAHEPGEVGSCYTEFDEAVTCDNFIDLLKMGMYRGVDMRKVSRWVNTSI